MPNFKGNFDGRLEIVLSVLNLESYTNIYKLNYHKVSEKKKPRLAFHID